MLCFPTLLTFLLLRVTLTLAWPVEKMTGNSTYWVGPANCTAFNLPITIEDAPNAFIDPTAKEPLSNKTQLISGTYSIHQTLCIPSGWENGGPIILAIHGLGFDSRYWDFQPDGDTSYDFIAQAGKDGIAVLAYDRLGAGQSDHPNGFEVVQLEVEVAIAAQLVARIKGGFAGHTFGKITVVGHSYGSVLTWTLATFYPEDISAIVLTGFSAQLLANESPLNLVPETPTATGYFAATAASILGFFLYPGHYDQKIIEPVLSIAQNVTIGQILTIALPYELGYIATKYYGAAYVITGAEDVPFCGYPDSACLTNYNNPVLGAGALFPEASSFNATIVPTTGHGLMYHYSRTDVFQAIFAHVAK